MTDDGLLVTTGLAVAVALLLLLYRYLTLHLDHWTRLGVAGPKPRLAYGNFPSVLTNERHIIYDIDEVYTEYKAKHHAIGVFMTRSPELLILDPKLAYHVMVTDFRRFRDNTASRWVMNPAADKFAARNPFFTTGEEWKVRRADALAGLTSNKLSQAYPIWKASAAKLGAYLGHLVPGDRSEVEAKDLAYRFTANVMGDFLWGIDAGALEGPPEPNAIVQMGRKMLEQSFVAVGRYFSLHLVPSVARLTGTRFFPEETDRFFSQLTKDAVAMRQSSSSSSASASAPAGNQLGRADFLNHVLQLQEKKRLGHDDVMGHVLTAMLDGFETSGTVLCHTLFYLARNQAAQDRLRAEIRQHLGEDGFLSFEDLTGLPYLDQCVHETIRLITPIPMFSRICTEPTTLQVEGGRSIPVARDSVVTIPVFSYHHDPDYFPRPYDYSPERFDGGAHVELTRQGVFMPFGNGPRICLGMRMGLFEVKTALVEVLRRFRVVSTARTLAEKKPDSNSFILGLEGDFWLGLERVDAAK